MKRAAPALPVLALLAAPVVASGATYDPDLTWRTIKTDHFHIHFHQGEEQLAEEFSTTVEDVYDTMVDELIWRPRRRTHVVLIDRTDAANGFAGSVPYNAITIFVTGPGEGSTLGQYEDWLTGIQTHEFTHTLHIDTNYGVARVARWVIGRVSSTNRLSPAWMVEGLATFQETRHSNGGRGRTPTVDMILRTAALEDDIPPLGRMDGFQAQRPGGSIRYLFGRDFMQHVADHYGEDVWTRWTHTYGASVPYLLPGRFVLGGPLHALHADWARDLRRDAEATVASLGEEAPLTEGRFLSDDSMSCIAPTFAPTGDKLVWSCSDPKRGSQIWMADGEGNDGEVLLQDRGASSFAWRRDGGAFAYAGTHVVNRFNTWSDLYLHTLGTKGASALTQGARARDPDFSPDGGQLVMVTNKAQNNQLEVLTVDRKRERITDFHDHTQLGTPRFSPDGRVLAVSAWRDGRRDLWLVTPQGEFVRRLTTDDAIERDIRWSADGRWIYFSSDRSGIPQVYAVDTRSERLWQVTNVATGAVAPSPHPAGTRIAWQEYHRYGWRIVVADTDRGAWIDHGLLPRPLRHGAPIAELTDLVEREPAPVEAATDLMDGDTALAPSPTDAASPTARGAAAVPEWTGLAQTRERRFGVPIDPVAIGLPGVERISPARQRGALPPEAFRQSTGGIDSFDQANVEGVFGEEADYPFTIEPKRYTPLGTLAPRYWVPYVQTSTLPPRAPFDFLPFAFVASANTGSVDPLRHYAWSAGTSYRSDANFVSGAASFTLNRYIPVYSVSVSRRASAAARYVFVDEDNPVNEDGTPRYLLADQRDPKSWFWLKNHTISASVNYPYTFKTGIFARYAITFRDSLDDIPAWAERDFLPFQGALATLQGGWRYSYSQPTSMAISAEDARIVSLVGGIVHPYLGAYAVDESGAKQGLTALQMTAEIREYRVMPWLTNHVLAVRAAGGATLGTDRFLGLYQLGGNFGESAFYVSPTGSRMVRGYAQGSDVGDIFWLAAAEYRFPIARFDRGLMSWPVFFRALSGNVFVDAGNAFSDPTTWRDPFQEPLIGVGGELRLSMALWYGVGTTLRAGVATGLTPGGIRPVDPTTGGLDADLFYLRVGGSY